MKKSLKYNGSHYTMLLSAIHGYNFLSVAIIYSLMRHMRYIFIIYISFMIDIYLMTYIMKIVVTFLA